MPTLTEKICSIPEGRRAWHQERLSFEFTERLAIAMNDEGVSYEELARRLERSPRYVTALLDGTTSRTIAEMSDAFLALGRQLVLSADPAE